MQKIKDKDYICYVIAPFNSKMIIDYSCLIGNYEKFRKALCRKINNEYPNQLIIEKFSRDDDPRESIQNWLKEEEIVIKGEIDTLLFRKTGGSGETQRDKSLITININEKYQLPIDIIDDDVFSDNPIFIFEIMSFHEYGVGMIYCKVMFNLKQELTSYNEKLAVKILQDIMRVIIRHPDLIKLSESIGEDVYKAFDDIDEEFNLENPVVTYEELFTNQKANIPLWGHIVLIRDDNEGEEKVPVKYITDNIIAISHPDGGINFAKGTKGFVHIGWGNSLWANLEQTELEYAKEILRYCEIEWRTLQVFNEILLRQLNQLSSYQTFRKKFVKRAIKWINKLRMEMELYSVNKANYLQNLAPFAHFIYNEAIISWRISQMEEFFMNKIGVFKYLHNQGREKLKELSDSKINNILFIFTCLSLVSTFIDGIMFVVSENLEQNITFRLFLLLFPPIAFIILIVILIERIISSRS